MTDASSELETLRTALAAARAEVAAMAGEATRAKAAASGAEAVIAALRLEVEKLRRALYGRRSERQARLLDQLELQLEELEATASEGDLAAEQAAGRTKTAPAAPRRHPTRKPFPEHLPRERVVVEVALRLCSLRLGSDRQARGGRRAIVRHRSEDAGERDAGGGPAVVEGDPDGP